MKENLELVAFIVFLTVIAGTYAMYVRRSDKRMDDAYTFALHEYEMMIGGSDNGD